MASHNVLFLCTGNSARSILAEAYLNSAASGRFVAYSAGSHPAGKVNPFALELLRKHGISSEGLRSKNWDEFARPRAPSVGGLVGVDELGQRSHLRPGGWRVGSRANAPGRGFLR